MILKLLKFLENYLDNMKEIKNFLKKIDSVDIVLLTAMGLYMSILIPNLIKLFS